MSWRAALGHLTLPKRCPRRRFDGMSDGRTEFVRDVSDGLRRVCRRLLFCASVLGPLANPSTVIAVAFHRTAGIYNTQERCQRDRRTLAGSGQHRQHTGDSGGHTGSTAASVFTGLRRARKRQRITTRRARDFRTRRAASVTVRTYPQRDNANEPHERGPRRDDG